VACPLVPILVFRSELLTLLPVSDRKLILATRKSPLALAQSEMVAAHLTTELKVEVELQKFVTTGDRQTEWSLEQKGGKGLFTSELEASLLSGESDLAVHSTKDLPGEMPEGLMIAGYMPRADARDVLVLRDDVDTPTKLATGSPRRRWQLQMLFPNLEFCEIRGNVDTRFWPPRAYRVWASVAGPGWSFKDLNKDKWSRRLGRERLRFKHGSKTPLSSRQSLMR
jgi:hypothetical protein